METPPWLSAADVLTPEELQCAATTPVFSPAQLHLLKQQVDALRRIGCQLKAWRQRGSAGGAAGGPLATTEDGFGGAIRILAKPQRRASTGGGRGRAPPAKRRRGGSKQEEADESSGEEEGSEEEEEEWSSDGGTSEDEHMAEAQLLASPNPMDTPRRTGRQRRPLSAAGSQPGQRGSGSEGDAAKGNKPSSSGSESEGAGEGAASGDGRRGARSRASSGKKDGRQQPVAQHDSADSDKPIPLPKLQPVKVAWAEGEDAACSVCGEGDAVEENLILLCEGKDCSVAVHQQCYGVAVVPEGTWLCDACQDKLKPTAANCACCPAVGGALRKVVSLGRVIPTGPPERTYAHLACALWTPELTIAQPEQMRGIVLEALTPSRVALKCELCKQAGGAVIQCRMGSCLRAFHVLCGRQAGQQFGFRVSDGDPLAFCAFHSKPSFKRQQEALMDGGSGAAAAAEAGGG